MTGQLAPTFPLSPFLRGHVTEKHVLIACKHDMLCDQMFEVLRNIVDECSSRFTCEVADCLATGKFCPDLYIC